MLCLQIEAVEFFWNILNILLDKGINTQKFYVVPNILLSGLEQSIMINLDGMKSIAEFVTYEFEIIFEQWNDPFDSILLKIVTIIVYAVEIFASLIMLAFVVHETRGLFGHYRTLINQLLSYLYGGVSIILCALLLAVKRFFEFCEHCRFFLIDIPFTLTPC